MKYQKNSFANVLKQGLQNCNHGERYCNFAKRLLMTLKFLICFFLARYHSVNDTKLIRAKVLDEYGLPDAYIVGAESGGSGWHEDGTEYWSSSFAIPFGWKNWFYFYWDESSP